MIDESVRPLLLDRGCRYQGGALSSQPSSLVSPQPSLAQTRGLSPPHSRSMEDMDQNLMNFVNVLGAVTFVSIVAYHFITATPKDAEM